MKRTASLRKNFTRIAVPSLVLLLLLPFGSWAQQSHVSAKSPTHKSAPAPTAPSQPFHEDWATLTLEHSNFQHSTPDLAFTDDIPNTAFIRQRYQVSWRPKDPFDLYVIRPRNVAKAPVILYLYSFPDDTDQFKDNHWCEAAVRDGYAAVGFVSALTGHRTRYRLLKESFVSEMQEALASTTHDVQLVLDYLATRKDLDLTRVGMFGLGSGGSIAILASAADPRIVALDLLSPWGDWPRWLAGSQILRNDERAALLKPDSLAKVASLEPVAWLPKIKAKALRIQDVRSNKSIPDKCQEELEAAAPAFALVNQFGNGRAFLTTQPQLALLDWIKDQLKSGPKSQVVAEKSQRVHFFPAIEAPAQNWPNVGKPELDKSGAAAKQKDDN